MKALFTKFETIAYYAAFVALLILLTIASVTASMPETGHLQVLSTILMFVAIALLILLPKPKRKQKTREPTFVGSGIFMHQQFQPAQLVKGDKCWDADWGYLKWDGKEWQQTDD
jgi:hypothetical protein